MYRSIILAYRDANQLQTLRYNVSVIFSSNRLVRIYNFNKAILLGNILPCRNLSRVRIHGNLPARSHSYLF